MQTVNHANGSECLHRELAGKGFVIRGMCLPPLNDEQKKDQWGRMERESPGEKMTPPEESEAGMLDEAEVQPRRHK